MSIQRPDIEVSVVVPTHLPSHLDRTLLGLGRQTEPAFEVIVVENGARSDDVGALCGKWRKHLRLHHHFDPAPGLNRARNTGVRKARGEYAALLDDDCKPVENWVECILRSHREFPDAAAIGGPVRLDFESRPPGWLVGEFRTCLSELDRGSTDRILDAGEFVFGANMTFRISLFEEAGGFPEDIGMSTRGSPQLANDEIAFLEQALDAGGAGLGYCAAMTVDHFIPASRVSLERMLQRRLGQGLSDVALLYRKHGAGSDELMRRYMAAVFPHRWHNKQVRRRLAGLEPEPAGQYLHHHVVCRVGYLWGFRRALSRFVGLREVGLPSAIAGAVNHADTTSRLAELMYRGAGSSSASVRKADNRLRQLLTMARLLEPTLFEALAADANDEIAAGGIALTVNSTPAPRAGGCG
jgi:GT2 family glycosyltransferase